MKIAFLGGGMIAQICHIPFYLADPRCTVIAISESRPSLIAALTDTYRLPVVPDHRAIIDDPSVEAVVICAPRQATGPLTLMALEAGKHVVAEKPMAHTLAQGERLVAAAAARRLRYLVGYMKRHDPGVIAAREALTGLRRSGSFGRLLTARFFNYTDKYAGSADAPMPKHARPAESRPIRFPAWPLSPDWLIESLAPPYAWYVNVISHDVNMLRYLLGDEVTPLGAVRPNDRTVTAQFSLGDTIVTVDAVRSSPGLWMEGAEFVFEEGRLTMEVPWPMNRAGVTRVMRHGLNKPLETVPVPAGWAFERQAHAFIDTLSDGSQNPCSGADCLGDLALIENVWQFLSAQEKAI